jgi:hypothetical protein
VAFKRTLAANALLTVLVFAWVAYQVARARRGSPVGEEPGVAQPAIASRPPFGPSPANG